MSFIVQPVAAPSIFKLFETNAAGAGGNVDFLLGDYDALIYSGFASASTVLNITQATGTTLNETMSVGDFVTLQYQIKNSATNFNIDYIQIDSGAGQVNLSLPESLTSFTGFSDSLTTYAFEIFKIADNQYNIDVEILEFQQPTNPSGITVFNASGATLSASIQIDFQSSGTADFNFYQVKDSNNQIYAPFSSSPAILTGFGTGTLTFQVAAVYPAGVGTYSTASNSLTINVPDAPTMGSAVVGSSSGAVVNYTPGSSGWSGASVLYYTVSNPSGITASTAGTTVTIEGLTTGTNYFFTTYAENAAGVSPNSAASNSVNTNTYVAPGQIAYISAGTYSFIAPTGVTEVSVVAVGGGGGGSRTSQGGTTGETSFFISAGLVAGFGGLVGTPVTYASGGSYVGDGGGDGGDAPNPLGGTNDNGGGGGAGGYSGKGGRGGRRESQFPFEPPTNGTGGGGAGGDGQSGAGPGGGVGILGEGANGIATGGGGSGGTNGTASSGPAGVYGGGAGMTSSVPGLRMGGGGGGLGWKNNISVTPGNSYTVQVGAGGVNIASTNQSLSTGGVGAVRIIWRGNGASTPTRAFPSTNTGNL